jgi:hypothetical protein
MPRQYPGYTIDPSMATRMAAQLRQEPTYPTGGGTVGNRSVAFNANQPIDNSASMGQQSGGQSQISPQTAQNMMKMAQQLRYGGGATQAAGQAAMPAMSAGGGSSLGSMGLQQGAVNFPGAASAGGGTGAGGGGFMSKLGGMFGGGGGGGGAGAGGGMMSNAGGLGALAALSYLGDKEMNESKGSFINADKLNKVGTVGKSGIGLRFGDFANGFNPATWLSDPKKAAKGLGNAFTFGLLDKVI